MLYNKFWFIALLLNLTGPHTILPNFYVDIPITFPPAISAPLRYCPQAKYDNNTFPTTDAGSWAVPVEMEQIGKDFPGTTLARLCFFNGTWAVPRIYPLSAISAHLYTILILNNTTAGLWYTNLSTYYDRAKLTTIDIHFISSILVKAADCLNKENEAFFIATIDNLLWLDKYHLTVAQQHFNATDRILYGLNRYLLLDNRTKNFEKTRFTVKTLSADTHTISGLFVLTENHNWKYEELDEDDDPVEEMERKEVTTAFQVFRKCHVKDAQFYGMFFGKDTLFARDYTDLRHPTPIISFTFPDNLKKKCFTMRIFYKDSQSNFNRTCDYWNYGDDEVTHLQGQWSGKEIPDNPKHNIFSCNYTKGSHFSMIRLFKYGRECGEEYIPCLNLTFPATAAGSCGIPLELCLQDDYTPVRRTCYHNATWGPILGTCSQTVSITSTTKMLYGLLQEETEDITPAEITKEISYNITEVRPIDVHFLSKIVDNFGTNVDFKKIPAFLKNIANMMAINKKTLRKAQVSLNSTDMILYAMDRFLLNVDKPKNYSFANLSIQTASFTTEQIGVMIKDPEHFQTLYSHNYSRVLQKTDYVIAFRTFLTDRQYHVAFYNNDHLFNEKESEDRRVNSAIVGILSPDETDSTIHDLEIFFKVANSTAYQNCHHWKYGYDNNNAVKGKWSPNSVARKHKHGFFSCRFNHTTHFAMLISDTVPDDLILDFITVFGSALSAMGLVTIVMTAVTFKEWRKNSSNKVILNIAVCLLLEIVLFYISGEVDAGTACVIIGALLHYLILSQFCWMLVICYCHYRRLVMVFNSHINNALTKYCILCWGFPLLIVATIIGTSPETYDKDDDDNDAQICYPKGIYLKLGIIMPISIILTINFIAYIVIIKNLMKQFDSNNKSPTKSYAVHKSVFLMFFMIGITWIFGFVAGFTGSSLFLYLFCTTATCQGFIMSIFYILDSASTRGMWKNKIKDMHKSQSDSRVASVVPSVSATITE